MIKLEYKPMNLKKKNQQRKIQEIRSSMKRLEKRTNLTRMIKKKENRHESPKSGMREENSVSTLYNIF